MSMAQSTMYPVLIKPDELPPWNGPYPYSSDEEPGNLLPVFSEDVSPVEWARYHRWLESSRNLDPNDVVVRGVTVYQAQSLAPGQWLYDSILHYFTKSLKSTFRIHESSVVFFLPIF